MLAHRFEELNTAKGRVGQNDDAKSTDGGAQIVMIFESLMMATSVAHHYLVRSTGFSTPLPFP